MSDSDKMITREKAVKVLYDLINSGILSESIELDLQSIVNCIGAEYQLEIHAWGMPASDLAKLYTAHRTDLPDYEDFCRDCDRIRKEWAFSDKTTSS